MSTGRTADHAACVAGSGINYRALRSAAALGALIASLPALVSADAKVPPTPAQFVMHNIESPLKTKEGKPAPGTSAERRARQKTLPPSYTKKFDLTGLPDYEPEQKVSGKIRFWGNNYIDASGLGQAWADGFKKYHPGIEFELVLPTAAVATPSLYFGLADVAMTHEPTFYDSLAHLRILGFEPTGFMAITGSYDVSGWMNNMVIAVHKDNPLAKITMEELDGVFGAVRVGGWDGVTWRKDWARGPEKDIRTWDKLGLTGAEWQGKKITPYGYSTIYSTSVEFSRRVLGASGKWNGDFQAYGNVRNPDGSQTIQYAQIVDALKKDKYGIAFLRYQKSFPKELKVLSLAWNKKEPYVDYTMQNVFNRSYPLTGEMSLYSSVKPGSKMDPKVKEFTRYVLSREGQSLVQDVDQKYLPLSAQVVKEELARLAKY